MDENRLHLENIMIKDKIKGQIYFGGDQDWFTTKWQQDSECAPTTASAIVMCEYLQDIRKQNKCEKSCFLELMENIWEYITPTSKGVYTLEMFADGYERYIREHYQIGLVTHFLKISEDKKQRISNKAAFDKLKKALKRDHPIAFLNLDHGAEKNLYSWHWVTIVGLSYNREKNELGALIDDEGLIKPIDLGLWIKTTSRGGGFIYFETNYEKIERRK